GEEQGRGGGRYPCVPAWPAVRLRPPEMVANAEEHQHRGDEVNEEIERVIAPRLEARDRVVDRVRDEQHGPEIHRRVVRPVRVAVGEEARDVPQTLDRGITDDPVRIVEVEADSEPAGVREADADREDAGSQDGESTVREKRG